MLSSRFIVQAVGPEGGSRTKSGIRSVQAYLFHGEAQTSLTVHAFLQEGVPYVEISAFRSGKHHTLYKGPLDTLVPQA